ncbi:MAG: ABC transporter ATP-binding protein [Chitinophagales bacterium]|nr:ABC transporter ATP-binding protein [Chitinophagales bacterium]
MIQVNQLNYEYPDKRALEDVSFHIAEGSITALVGPNGAGKTTLLRALSALSKPVSGTVFIDGKSAIDEPREVHLRVGYLSDFFGLYDQLTVEQSLAFTAYSRLDGDADFDAAIERAIERSGVNSFRDKKISALSRGMRQRVGIAQAIIHQPKVLLLDEPASGLDPEARHSLSNLLLELRDSGMTIIVSSHILAELEDYSTDMLVIQDGKMIEHRTLNTNVVSAAVLLKNMTLRLEHPVEDIVLQLEGIDGVSNLLQQENTLTFQLAEDVVTKHQLLKRLIGMNIPVSEFSEHKANLQEEYIKTVSAYKKQQV